MSTKSSAFHPIRSLLWPIHKSELSRFIPLFLLHAFIAFNYSLLKVAKDTLVITANPSGASVISFIKIWAILPMAILVTYLSQRLFRRFTLEKVFYIITSGFILFFLLFILFIYPNKDLIHPTRFCNYLEGFLPSGFSAFIGMIRNWSFTLFYSISELWGTMVMSVLFWGAINETTSLGTAKRFYGILGVGANISSIFAGHISILASQSIFKNFFVFFEDPWENSLAVIIGIVIITGLISIGLFYWYNRALPPQATPKENDHIEKKLNKKKMGSIAHHFQHICKSKYLICMALLVIGFHLSINIVEIVWKDRIHLLYPNPNAFNAYLGNIVKITGIFSTVIALFFSGNLLRRMGWTFSALITPVTLLVTGFLFFTTVIWQNHPVVEKWAASLGYSALGISVFFGAVQNVFSRGLKYTLFDTTKEVALTPLPSEEKFRGKAAIDGIVSRLAKTGGSLFHGSLFLIFGNIAVITPFVGGFLLVIVLTWIGATKSLGQQFNQLAQAIPNEEEAETNPILTPEAATTIKEN